MDEDQLIKQVHKLGLHLDEIIYKETAELQVLLLKDESILLSLVPVHSYGEQFGG